MEKIEFDLQEGEEIVKIIKPSKKLIFYFILAGFIRGGCEDPRKPFYGPEVISSWIIIVMSTMIIGILVLMLQALSEGRPLIPESEVFPGFALGALILLSIVDAIFLPIPYLMYRRRLYYVTNKRIIIRKGLIHSKILLIPLGNIYPHYIWISNTFLERMCGFRSIYFGDQQMNPTKSMLMEKGSIGDLPILYAVPEPERTKELILSLKKEG